MQLRTTT